MRSSQGRRLRAPSLPACGSAILALLLAASCALFEPEESLSPTPTITVPAPATLPGPTDTAASTSTTSTSQPATTTTAPTTTTTTPAWALAYLERLLEAETDIARLVSHVQDLNDNWDDRSQTGVSLAETASGLEEAAELALALEESFALIEAPSSPGLGDEHRIAGSAVAILADSPQQMLDGLRSADSGQARRASLVGFLTAFDILEEVITRVAAIIGGEGTAMLETHRSTAATPATTSTAAPEPAPEEPAATTTSSTVTTAGPAPANPGNTKNCSDFSTQAEAQEWFDTYFPFYGDVARLDTNGNDTACEFLP